MQPKQFSDGRTMPTRSEIEPFVAACVQAAPVNFDSEKTLEKVRALAADVAGMLAK